MSATAGRSARVITVSTRAARGDYADRSGPVAVAALRELGYAVPDADVVPDGPGVEAALRAAVAAGVDVVITSGGTGISPGDVTPEMTRRVIDREIPGIAETLRAAGAATVPTAVLSRGIAGTAGRAVVVNLPGSPGGVRDGLRLLAEVLPHAVEQANGRTDHAADATGPRRGVVLSASITSSPISTDEHARLVGGSASGAIVTFAGVVRDHDSGRTVTRLEYEAHPSAETVLRSVADDVVAGSPVHAVAVSHRVGALTIGDVALACAVSGSHRGDAFAACQVLVDEVKRRLPVWKLQVFADGTQEWVGAP